MDIRILYLCIHTGIDGISIIIQILITDTGILLL